MDGYETTATAAERIGCSQQHVRRLVLQGKLRGQPVTPRLYLVDSASVDEYRQQPQGPGYPRGRPRKLQPAE